MVENYTMRERMSGAINALSISPEGNSVVVAGRESKILLSRVSLNAALTMYTFYSFKDFKHRKVRNYRNIKFTSWKSFQS